MTKIIPCRFYRTPEGRTFSLFTSWKPDDAVLVTEGFTTDNDDGTQGCGRVPFKTEQEGKDWLANYKAKFGRDYRGMARMGD